VQTGVKSAGWLKRTNHFPLKSSGIFIFPWVVCTVIWGKSSPNNGILIFVSSYVLFPKENPSLEWKKFSEVEYNNAIKQDEIIIMDFYADWCIPCKELDAVTFSNNEVINRTKDFTLLKVDMTKSISPEVEKLKQQFSIVGVPTILIIDSTGNEVKRITGFVSPEEFLNILNDVK